MLIAFSATANKTSVFMNFHRKGQSSDKQIERISMRLPIEVFYDEETLSINVLGNEAISGEVFLLDDAGNVVDYSSVLNTTFPVVINGNYTVCINGCDWYAIGYLDVK